MNEFDLVKAIRKLKPNAEFTFNESDYATIKWDVLEGEAPTEAELDAALKEVKAEEAQAKLDKATEKVALLERLGITTEEAKLLLS